MKGATQQQLLLKGTKMCEVVFLLLVFKPLMDRTVEANRKPRRQIGKR